MPQVQTSISVDSQLLATADSLAKAENRSRSNMIAVLLGEALAARQKAKGQEQAA